MNPKLEDWLNEREGFSIRKERLIDDIKQNPDLVYAWLEEAFNQGQEEIKAKVDDELFDLEEYLTKLWGCHDGNCVIGSPSGMHTNGGCRCSTDRYMMQRFAYANNKCTCNLRDIIGRPKFRKK